jgi:uncharacterized protein YqgV (UPF0045/DUF77 family)
MMGVIITKFTNENKPDSNKNEIDIESSMIVNNETKNKDPIDEIISQLEQDGYNKLKNLNVQMGSNETTLQNYGDSLLQIVKDGATEFEKKAGRKMTYSEMREAYG